jgi:hypothetical protein
MGEALLRPPENPDDCLFAKMSANYSADLKSRVEPCVFGGTPDCSQCGCTISSALHWIKTEKVVGPFKVGHFVSGSINAGLFVNKLRAKSIHPSRWRPGTPTPKPAPGLIHIQP